MSRFPRRHHTAHNPKAIIRTRVRKIANTKSRPKNVLLRDIADIENRLKEFRNSLQHRGRSLFIHRQFARNTGTPDRPRKDPIILEGRLADSISTCDQSFALSGTSNAKECMPQIDNEPLSDHMDDFSRRCSDGDIVSIKTKFIFF